MSQAITDESRLVIYTICDHPSDYPEHFTIRREFIAQDHPVPVNDPDYLELCDTIADARKKMRELGLFCVPATVNDDPIIVESWM